LIDFEVVFEVMRVCFASRSMMLQYTSMKRFAKFLALGLYVVMLLIGSTRSVAAQTVGIGDAVTAGATVGAYSSRSSLEKNVSKMVEAVVDATDKGVPSLNNNVDDTSLSWQTSFFLSIGGVSENSLALSNLTEEQKRIVYERYGGGAIGAVGTGIAALYTPPASSTTYIADLLHSAHIIPQAQAQGLGFAALDPILETWKVFRNVAYLFFVLIFLAIGFMIMFRQKIGGQTVVTAQQAIPGIIISLIFVTFSYAIAGFMIDIMYLLMYLLVGLFNPSQGTGILDHDIFGAIWRILIGEGEISSIFSSVGDAVGQLTGSFAGDLVGDLGDALGWLAGITAALVVGVAIVIAAFKIFFELLKTYISIIISVATAPVMLMLGAIPGQNNFFKWLKGLFGNLMVFPTVLMAFIIYDMFTQQQSASGGVGQGGFIPPFLPGRGAGNAIVTLVGIGILLVIPEIIKEVKKAFGAEGGIAETLAGAALSQAKEGLPLSSRVIGVGGLGAATSLGGAAWEFGRGIAGGKSFGDSLRLARGSYDPVTGQATGAQMYRTGANLGARAAGWASRITNANQPDVLNIITNPIDKAFNPEGFKRQELFELYEDANQRIQRERGGVGKPAIPHTEK
jgi:hypothetical protein